MEEKYNKFSFRAYSRIKKHLFISLFYFLYIRRDKILSWKSRLIVSAAISWVYPQNRRELPPTYSNLASFNGNVNQVHLKG